MDHHDSKASKTESKCGCPSSPVKDSPLAQANSLVDANVRIQEQGYEYDCETNSCKAEKLNGIERNDRNSYLACTRESKIEKQCKTESSSSNTPHANLPATSNDSSQEKSSELQSCKIGKIYAIDYSTCTELKSDIGESVVGRLQPGIEMRSADVKLEHTTPVDQCNMVRGSETLDRIRTRNSDNLTGMNSENNYTASDNIYCSNSGWFKKETSKVAVHGKPELLQKLEGAGNVAPAVAKDADQEFEASESSSIDEKNSETFRASFVDSVGSSRKSCLTEKSLSFCSVNEGLDTRSPTKNESAGFDAKHEVNDLHGQGSSSQTMTAKALSSRAHISNLSKIDLNEDAMDHDVGYLGVQGKETVPDLPGSLSKPKPVMAKPGTPVYFLASHTQDKGKLGGWRGSTANSAFRPTLISKNLIEDRTLVIEDANGNENRLFIKSIDLNLDPAGAEHEIQPVQDKYNPSNMEAGSKQARKLDFDLNCSSENDDDGHNLSPTPSLSWKSVRDFDLNDSLVPVDTCKDSHQCSQGVEALRKTGPDSPTVPWVGSSEQRDFRSFRPAHSVDFRSVPGFVPPNLLPSSEQLQRISFLQPHLAYTPSLPHGFQIDPKAGFFGFLGTHGMLPVDPHPTTIGSGALPAFPSHVFQAHHGPSTNVDAYSGVSAGQLGILSSNSALEDRMKSFQQVAGSAATGMKRREPECGWDSNQLRFGKMSYWR